MKNNKTIKISYVVFVILLLSTVEGFLTVSVIASSDLAGCVNEVSLSNGSNGDYLKWDLFVNGHIVTVKQRETHLKETDISTSCYLYDKVSHSYLRKFDTINNDLILDVKDIQDGVYDLYLFAEDYWSSCPLKIVDGYSGFYLPRAGEEESFYASLALLNPSDYDELPVYSVLYKNLDKIAGIVHSLTVSCNTQEDKVLSIHNWIAQNIAYDYATYYGGEEPGRYDSYDRVFERGYGICEEYSRLARTMFAFAGIPCVIIHGQVGTDPYDLVDHAWNAVYVDGAWKILDITWDSPNAFYGLSHHDNIIGMPAKYTYYEILPSVFSQNHYSEKVTDDSIDLNTSVQYGWNKINSKWYFFDANHQIKTGWIASNGKWYYLDPLTGVMATGWKYLDGSWYYMDGNGVMLTGLWHIDGYDYGFKSNGTMAYNEWYDGRWYSSSGANTYKATGSWKWDSVGWWFGDSYGWYARNEVVRINGMDYQFNSAGYLVQ